MTVDIVTVGGCTVDIVYAADGFTPGRQLGGNAIYAAAGARVWGLRPGVVALRGTGIPNGWENMLASLEIDTGGMVPVDVPASVTEFFYDRDGERTQRVWTPHGSGAVVPYLPADTGEPIRRLRLAPEHIPAHYLDARGAHLAPIAGDAQREMTRALCHLDVLTLDPYPHVMAEWTHEDLKTLLARAAAFLPSRDEVRARFRDLTPEAALDRLATLARIATVIKMGRRGALVYDRVAGRRDAVPAVPVQVKDPTGAGDAFCGGFLAGLLEGRNALGAAACGAVSASFAIEDFSLDGIRRATPAERDRRTRWVLEHAR
ncbi:MAG: carbohydrate kinase family protein [bacterium]